MITVPVSTALALLISLGLSSIKKLRQLFQTIYFLPYVTNTLAVGLVFMLLFRKTPYTDGLVTLVISFFGAAPIDFIDGPYWAKMFVLCFYTVWVVLPFKILVLTGALASVRQDFYNAAAVDGTSKLRQFCRITLQNQKAKAERNAQNHAQGVDEHGIGVGRYAAAGFLAAVAFGNAAEQRQH